MEDLLPEEIFVQNQSYQGEMDWGHLKFKVPIKGEIVDMVLHTKGRFRKLVVKHAEKKLFESPWEILAYTSPWEYNKNPDLIAVRSLGTEPALLWKLFNNFQEIEIILEEAETSETRLYVTQKFKQSAHEECSKDTHS